MGWLSALRGDQAESAFLESLMHYEQNEQISWLRNWPKIVVKKFPKAQIVGKGGPDFSTSVAQLGGKTVHFEVKTIKAKNQHFYTFAGDKAKERRHDQFDMLRRMLKGHAMVFYIVLWRWPKDDLYEWRLYPVLSFDNLILPIKREHNIVKGIEFVRSKGLKVSSENGYPDWMPIVLNMSLFKAQAGMPSSGGVFVGEASY